TINATNITLSNVRNGGYITLDSGFTLNNVNSFSAAGVVTNGIGQVIVNGTIGNGAGGKTPITSVNLSGGLVSGGGSSVVLSSGSMINATNIHLYNTENGGYIALDSGFTLNNVNAFTVSGVLSNLFGQVIVNGTIGNGVGGATAIPTVTLNGGQVSGGASAVVLSSGSVINASALAINNQKINANITIGSGAVINSGAAVSIYSGLTGSTVTFNDVFSSVASLSVTGAAGIFVNTPNTITTSGAQTYNNAVTTTGNTSFASTGGNITFSSTVAGGGSITVNNAVSTTSAFNNVVSGSGASIIKLGAGALTLSSASNSFTGGVFLNGGSLTTSSLPSAAGNSIIGTGNLSIDNAATLSYTGATGSFNRAITIASGGGTIQSTNASANTLTLTGGVTANGNVTFDTTGAGPANITLTTAGISGAGNIIKSGSGALTFAADNTYSGTTTISAGTLNIGNGGTAGTLGSGDLTNNSALVFNRSDAVSYSGVISGTGTLTKSGAGTLTLSGANTYSGGTTLNSGALTIGVASTGSVGNITNSAIGTQGLTLNGGTLQLPASSAFTLYNNYTVAGAATITVNVGNFTLSGTGSLNSGSLSVTPSNTAGTVVLGGNLTGAIPLNKSGSGILIVSGNNSGFSGATTLTGGILQIGVASNALGTGSLALNGGTILSTTAATLNNAFTMGGTSTIGGSNNLTFSNTGALNAGTLTITNSATTTLSGVLSGASGITFNTSNPVTGSLVLNNSNSYTGKTTVTAGTLNINSLANVGAGNVSALGAPTTIANGTIDLGAQGVLQYTGTGHSSNRVINLVTASGGTIDASGSGAFSLSGGVTG
ncbi:MAG TPA: autotransporter-associated beta strand repeat-containing protein, partial [Candidatus Babeliales bacterium]|nr:autotransporter-associated beta strand repeat-containing protein [Candidatus Babeliales bacterium]